MKREETETVAEVYAEAGAVQVWDFPDGPMRYIRRIVQAHKRELGRVTKAYNNAVTADAGHALELERMRVILENIEDQVRWTIAHIECDELDDATGALYTAETALEYINDAKGESK